MIQLPRRSVTRFFIPLVDVMMLLFCIFLLMPVVKPGEGYKGDPTLGDGDELARLRREVASLKGEGKDRLKTLQEEIDRLRQEKITALKERLTVRVLEIDPKTGKLFVNDPDRVEIRNQADAATLIERDRRERAVGQKELYYLFLYPRDPTISGFPLRTQQEQYDRWFKEAAVGYDVPGAKPNGGRQP